MKRLLTLGLFLSSIVLFSSSAFASVTRSTARATVLRTLNRQNVSNGGPVNLTLGKTVGNKIAIKGSTFLGPGGGVMKFKGYVSTKNGHAYLKTTGPF